MGGGARRNGCFHRLQYLKLQLIIQDTCTARKLVSLIELSLIVLPVFWSDCTLNLTENIFIYYMAKPVLGKSVCTDWFFLGRDFAVRTVSTWLGLYLCFGPKAANSKFATKAAKKKMWILSFFIAKLPEKAKRIEILLRFQRWMKKTNFLRVTSVLSWTSRKFWCRNWNRHRRKPGGQRRFYQPTEKCKHKQEDCYWYEHSSPLHWS